MLRNHPASFKVGEDPILYPDTVVFERRALESENSFVEVFNDDSESAEQGLGRIYRCVPHSPDHMHGTKADKFVRPALKYFNTPLFCGNTTESAESYETQRILILSCHI
jgi:hypothetical protein